jgi:cysteine synthase
MTRRRLSPTPNTQHSTPPSTDHRPPTTDYRPWQYDAMRRLEADFNRSSDTHLEPLPVPGCPEVHLYFKDESTHPTGSLKHRLARSLFLYALANNWLTPKTPVVEASSGSTAVSEAYFARLLGLRFLAVMPKATSPEKVRRIERFGGECVFVDDPKEDRGTAARLADDLGGHFMDQFTYAERATDWRGNNNIAESIYEQMALEPHPVPSWIICGAGTGGTSATIGRYIRYRCHETRLAVVDPENSDGRAGTDLSGRERHRGDRASARRAVVFAGRSRQDVRRSERRELRRDPLSGGGAGPPLRSIHWHESVRRVYRYGGDAGGGGAGERRHAHLRQRRTLPRYVLQSGVVEI